MDMTADVPGVRLLRAAERTSAVDALADRLGGRVCLTGVLGDLNRRVRRLPAPGSAVEWSLRWSVRDCVDREWWPQGVTSSADAYDEETFGGRHVLATSWYAKPREGTHKGSRISFVDLDSRTYRHVLLVVPSIDNGRLGLEPLRVHAGGIVWHGPYLHIAATRRGLFTARLDDVLRVPSHVNDLDTFGYRYVLPVCSTYEAQTDEGVEPMRYSFMSLARDGDRRRLVAGEYGRGSMTKRLACYALDRSADLVADHGGAARPEVLHAGGAANMQGAVIVDGRWHVTRSRGPRELGSLCVGEPGALDERQRAIPMGPEDLTYWPSTGTLWTVTEWPGRRWIVAIRPSP